MLQRARERVAEMGLTDVVAVVGAPRIEGSGLMR